MLSSPTRDEPEIVPPEAPTDGVDSPTDGIDLDSPTDGNEVPKDGT